MKSSIGHLLYNIDPANCAFYKDLFTFLGWSVWVDTPNMLGLGNHRDESVWFAGPPKPVANDYDGPGLNHLGIAVEEQADVERVVVYLESQRVAALFETPRHRPDFTSSPDQTYFQVMFESPDHILFEVVYIGPLQR